jgi:hypothetical protein
MTFGEILDRIYRLMRTNLRLFLDIASVPAAALLMVFLPVIGFMLVAVGPQLRGQASPPAPFPSVLAGIFILLGNLVFPVIYALYMPAASYAAAQADLGIAVTLREAYDVGWHRFGRYLWLMILGVLCIIVPVMTCVLVIVLGGVLLHVTIGVSPDSSVAFLLIPLGVLLYIAATVYSVLILLRFSLAYSVCVVEELPAWASLQRSVQLTKGAKGRIFLVLLVVYALTYLVSMVCIAIFFAVGALVALVAILAHLTQGSPVFIMLIGLAVLGYLLILVASCLFSYAVFTTTLAVLYHDQRLRKEGLLPDPCQTGEHQV